MNSVVKMEPAQLTGPETAGGHAADGDPESEDNEDDDFEDDCSSSHSSSKDVELIREFRKQAWEPTQKVAVLLLIGSLRRRPQDAEKDLRARLERKTRSRLELCGVPRSLLGRDNPIEIKSVFWPAAFATAMPLLHGRDGADATSSEHTGLTQRILHDVITFNAAYRCAAGDTAAYRPTSPSPAAVEAHRILESREAGDGARKGGFIAFLVIALAQIDREATGFEEQALAVGVGRQRRASARQRKAQRLGQNGR